MSNYSFLMCRVRWAPDGQTLASASDDRTVRLWELPDLALVHATPGGGQPAPATTPLVAELPHAAAPGSVEVAGGTWSAVELAAARVSYGHGARLWDVQFCCAGLVVSASEDCTCRRSGPTQDHQLYTCSSICLRQCQSCQEAPFVLTGVLPDGVANVMSCKSRQWV